MTNHVHVVDHPLVQHKLSVLRKKETGPSLFRDLLNDISALLAYEITRDLPMTTRTIETPLTTMDAPFLENPEMCLVSILRAGNGLLDGMLQLLPDARVGHIGLYRDPKTFRSVEYYFKIPPNMENYDTIVVDPMLATGHSAASAIDRIKSTKPKSMRFMCLLASPEGIEYLHEEHPDVPIYTASIDEGLNEKKYIVPGIGDAGDRMFGTQ
ncbi:uracil phosphoribosyltransferase [Marinibactrum halimedae]|uniref:Uracil phosphoribosyltransferase n=1 Tax=Marinibactrum halimedae TaxID=1444977 RepID=A0AA37T3D1_9GAMM|nr:uracil phosphoribosyltransferase [Marinibactrum halimedae]MCD9459330.1 uracil phosphoribosyltransferase [Marinibactrum halimedae]GLS25778.1 uracil phosphoribosyltransferase [Marinibactrum halimedae]